MILHERLPPDMTDVRPLPGVQPVSGAWLRADDAYAAQMAERRRLLDARPSEVLACPSTALEAAQELLDLVCAALPALGFAVEDSAVICPDGVRVAVDRFDPLGTLGRLVQCDLCLMSRPEGASEHVLSAAVLCFPAGWTLAEKIGRPLMRIHAPVDVYDTDLGRRVQRLFDGVQVGRPIWRFNRLAYDKADLFAPYREAGQRPHRTYPTKRPFTRAERQTILRLPRTRWVLFAIHTYVVRRPPAS